MTQTTHDVHTQDARQSGTYDIYFEIDCDCQELLDAIGLDYKQCEDDDTQNEVGFTFTEQEYSDVFDTIQMTKINEQVIASRILNHELAEYTTKVTVYTPSGDKIIFK